MSKRSLCSVIAALLLLSILTLKVDIRSVRAGSDSIIVPDDYAKIQWAIGNATEGDTIFVRNGTYYEHLDVNKPLTLVGESKETTIVDGNGANQTVIVVTAYNVVISGFTVQNSSRKAGTSYAGIKILGRGSNITCNHITKNKIGILVTSQRSRITENIVTKNGHGIALHASSEVTVEVNNLTANTVGISLAFSYSNMIVGNSVANSSEGGHGIHLSSKSFSNTIESNDLVNNFHGMWLVSSFDNLIVENIIANNELLGIELASSSSNAFYHNNIVNNPTPVRIDTGTPNESICIWDDGYPSGGNYWHGYIDVDEYSGPDQDQLGSDEIWDKPYVLDKNNRDRYPSVRPHGDISHIISDEGKLTAQAGLDKSVKVGTAVSFDARGSTGNIVTYEWDFGDGKTGIGVTCSHTYYETGTYQAALTVRDVTGNFDTDQLTVTVIADDTSPPVDTPSLWVSALAGVIVIVMVAALFWKVKISKKTKKKRGRKMRFYHIFI